MISVNYLLAWLAQYKTMLQKYGETIMVKILNQYIVSLLEKYCVLRNQQILKVYTEKLEDTICI